MTAHAERKTVAKPEPAKEEKKEEPKEAAKAEPKAADAEPKVAAKADPKAAAAAKPEAKAADAKPEAKADAAKGDDKKAKADPKHIIHKDCNPGEILAADGFCYFEAEAIQVNMALAQKLHQLGNAPNLPIRGNLGPIDASKIDACQKGQILAADNQCYSENDALIVNNSLIQRPLAQGRQQLTQFDANQEPEKVQTLIPEAYRKVSNDVIRNPLQRTTFYAQQPEKVEYPDALNHSKYHTTYYGQKNADDDELVQFNANIEPEKIHTLIPEAYRTVANADDYIMNLGEQRSTFYAQLDSDVKFDANIAPEKIHTLIPEAYRTLANDPSYPFNLGVNRSTFNVQLGSEFDPNSEPEKVLVPQTTSASHHTTYYDKKNSIWRQPVELLQKTDTVGTSNIDPWVYEFSSDVLKDIQHKNSDAKPAGALGQKNDIKTSAYIDEDVNMFTRPKVDPLPNIVRSKLAPKGPMVKGWDGLAQGAKDKVDIATNKYIDNEVHMFAKPEVETLPHNRKNLEEPKKGIPGW